MKKTAAVSFGIFAAVFLSFSAAAETVVITNTIGGNADELYGDDLITYQGASFNDCLEAEAGYGIFSGKLKLDAYNFNTYSFDPEFSARGYAAVSPFSFLNVAAGNSYFSTYSMKAGKLFALNEKPSYGKLLKNGLSLYSEIPFNEGKEKLSVCGGIEFVDFNFDRLVLDFGGEFSVKKLLSIGISAKDVTKGMYGKYSALAQFQKNDFKINGGFAYNNSDDDVLPAETRYSISLSADYKNKASGIEAAFDVVSGLNNEFIAADSEKIKTYADNGIPFMTAGSFGYEINDFLKAEVKGIYTNVINQDGSWKMEVVPSVSWTSKNEMFNVKGGLRTDFYESSGSVNLDFSVPLTFSFTFGF